jgi:hypothetical protein
MNQIDALMAADTLRVSSISFILSGHGVDGGMPQNLSSVCTSKAAGGLSFSLNAKDDLKTPYNFDIFFNGTQAVDSNGTAILTTSGDPIVNWIPNQDVNLVVNGITIQTVNGGFSTSLHWQPRMDGSSCQGESRAFVVGLNTVIVGSDPVGNPDLGPNSLKIHGKTTIGLTDFGADVNASMITLSASAGLEASPSNAPFPVYIKTEERRCGEGPLVGGIAHFWAETPYLVLPTDTAIHYQWSVTGGAKIVSPNDDAGVMVQLPAAPGPIEISVTVSPDGYTPQSAILPYLPQTSGAANLSKHLCDLQHLLLKYWFLVRDPGPSVASQFSDDELGEIRTFAKKIDELPNMIIAARDR